MNRIGLLILAVVLVQFGCYRQPSVQATLATSPAIGTSAGFSPHRALKPDPDRNASKATDSSDASGDQLLELGVHTGDDSRRVPDVTTGVPRAVPVETVFDFGTMEPLQSRSHSFTIRNEGDAPLEIRQGPSTCKCTLSQLNQDSIPAGEEASVKLTWRTTSENDFFGHEAQVLTNDSQNEVLIFRVVGKIRSTLSLDPPEFSLPSVVPGRPTRSKVVLNSEVWSGFNVFDLSSSLPGLQWSVSDVSGSSVALPRTAAKEITITLPGDMPSGYFAHTLYLKIEPEGESARLHEIPIKGRVVRRVAVYGKGIDSTGKMTLGKVRQGKGLVKHFTVKVRDEDPNLVLSNVEAEPDFIQLAVEPYEKANTPGLYRMTVSIPKAAPPTVRMGEFGKLMVAFKNPRLKPLEFDLEFAILGASDF